MWLFPALKVINKNSFVTLKEMGLAMINTSNYQNERKIVEVKDIKTLAQQA